MSGTDPDHRFIIDPIDGTTNFMHSLPFFAISVALERKGEIVAAVTYNPISDELFTAEKGAGAFLNNKRLRVANRTDIHEALIGCGIPHRGSEGQADNRAEIALVQAKAIGIRRLGSVTLELGYIAAGRLDAFWERNLKPWDLAAGILLVREAGGFTSDCDGEASPLQTGNIIAANADLLPQSKKNWQQPRKSPAPKRFGTLPESAYSGTKSKAIDSIPSSRYGHLWPWNTSIYQRRNCSMRL